MVSLAMIDGGLLIVGLFYWALALLFLLLLLLTILAWCFRWAVVRWVFPSALMGVVFLGSLPFLWAVLFPGYPDLSTPPVESEIAGRYTLAPESIERFPHIQASIRLNPDHAYEIKQMPEAWRDSTFSRTLPDCTGTWKIERHDDIYVISLSAPIFAHSNDPGRDSSIQIAPERLNVHIADKTWRRREYALVVPSDFNGPDLIGAILFVKDVGPLPILVELAMLVIFLIAGITTLVVGIRKLKKRSRDHKPMFKRTDRPPVEY